MRMLFKWAIPWSDRVYHASSHVKSPPRCTQAASKCPAGAEAPARPPQNNNTATFLLSLARGTRTDFATSRGTPALCHFFKETKFSFSSPEIKLFSPICTIHFDAHRWAKIAPLIGYFTYSQCAHFVEQNTTYSRYLFSWALLFHMKNASVRSRAA